MTTRTAPLSPLPLAADAGDCAFPVEAAAGASPRDPSFIELLRLRFRSDEEIMAQLQRGNADALTLLFARHSKLVFRIACRILRDPGEAEDAVQRVFLEVFRARQRFDPDRGNFRPWLVTLAYHVTFNQWRGLASQRLCDTPQLDEPAEESERGVFSNMRSENALLLRQALDRLQPRQRRTIEWVYFEGLTAQEIAVRTGESVRVVRHSLYRGLDKMRSLLGGTQQRNRRS